MNTVKLSRSSHLVMALALAFALSLPYLAYAINIGEVVMQSRLGKPLHVEVELMLGADEAVDDSCLFLAAPDPHEDDIRDYLTQARLATRTEGARQYVIVSSQTAFNDAFAKIKLQVKCPGIGSVTKTLTFLPDLDEPIPQAPITAPAIPALADSVDAPPVADTRGITGDGLPNVAESDIPGPAAHPAKKQPVSPARTTRKKQSRPTLFRLKLSGDPIDESRIGKISPDEREILLARQKLLDADDQMASFLALQHQAKQMQDELGEIKLKLAQLDSAPLQESPSPVPDKKPAIALNQTATAQPDYPELPRGLVAVLGLLLAILALWQGLRYYTRIKSRQATTPILKHPHKEIATIPAISPSTTTPTPSAPPARTKTVAPPSIADMAPAPSLPSKVNAKSAEENSMLEEAELYAVHGHPNKAIEILHEIVTRNPSHADAWLLLLSIYSSLANAQEFEKAARDFFQHNQKNDSWKMVQALGRTFDQNNPLYAGDDTLGAAAIFMPQIALNKRRPVGDILVEMGVLSTQDMKDCLANFDPKLHGRFGGYLVSRKLITHAQLNEALLHQQGIGTDGRPGAMPTLQDMENFLANYDPKRDGTIGEFLVSRKAITPTQLDQVLQQQSNNAEANIPQSGTAPASGRNQPPEIEFEPLEEKKTTPDFDVTDKFLALDFNPPQPTDKGPSPGIQTTPLFPPLPEIDLSLPDNKPGNK